MGRLPDLAPAVRFKVPRRRDVVVVGRPHSQSPESHGDLVARHAPIGATATAFGFFVKEGVYLWLD